MRAGDTSIIVAAFASWHEQHEPARRALDEGLSLIEHCALETYSVLTRLPAPHRASVEVVRDFLAARFKLSMVRLDARGYRKFLMELPERKIGGGSAYDALIAATAVAHSLSLLSCDRRAASIYERYGARVEIL